MSPMPTFPQKIYAENNCMKLKLQLFPIDDVTRRALEIVSTGITKILEFDL